MQREILSLLATTTSLTPAHNIAAREGELTVGQYLAAIEKWMQMKGSLAPSLYTERFMQAVGRPDLYTGAPGLEEHRGLFFEVNESGLLVPFDPAQRSGAEIVMSVGIDMADAKYLHNYVKAAAGLAGDKKLVIFHYSSSAGGRSRYMDQSFANHSFAPDEAKGFVQIFGHDPNRKVLRLGHSYAAPWERMTQEAAADQGVDMKNVSSIIFGMMPIWGENIHEGKFGKDTAELKTGPAIYVMAASDIMPYLTSYAIKAAKMAAMLEGDQAYLAFHHPEDKNKVFVILAPGILPATVGKMVNYAGHGFIHYLEATGFGPSGTVADPRLQPLHDEIARVARHEDLSRETLADRLSAKPLDVGKIHEATVDDNRFLAGALAQLLTEGDLWAAKIKPHPFVQGMSRI